MAHVRHTFSPIAFAVANEWKAILEKATALGKIVDPDFSVVIPDVLSVTDRTPSDALFQYQTTNGSATIQDPSGYGIELFTSASPDGTTQYTIDLQGMKSGAFVFIKLIVGPDGKIDSGASSVKVKCESDCLPMFEAALK
jgi:hypothetical protein